jgi:hypothetical protein
VVENRSGGKSEWWKIGVVENRSGWELEWCRNWSGKLEWLGAGIGVVRKLEFCDRRKNQSLAAHRTWAKTAKTAAKVKWQLDFEKVAGSLGAFDPTFDF